MRIIIATILLLIFISCKSTNKISTSSQKAAAIENKMNFHFNKESTIQNIFNLAKKENKLIFIYAYADWSLPCQIMNAEVFENNEVSIFMKENFINYKVDLENINGILFKEKYQILGFPTLLIIDQNATIKERNDGALNYSRLLKMCRRTLLNTNAQR